MGADDADFEYDGATVTTAMKLRGVYNIFNAAAALTLARGICGARRHGGADHAGLLTALSQVAPAFGRGESLVVDGLPLELVLVKNPSGFRLGLKSFPAAGYATMIAINDNYADGRDMSWLWDVEFDSLRDGGVDQLTGSRAYDMALRLQYDDVAIGAVDTDIAPALAAFIRGGAGQAEADLLHLHRHAGHPPRAVQNHHSGGGLMTPRSGHKGPYGHELPPEESPRQQGNHPGPAAVPAGHEHLRRLGQRPGPRSSACAGTATRRNCSSTTSGTSSPRTWT